MIDKLDLRVPCDSPYHPDFNRLYSELHHDSSKSPFHRSRYYEVVGDLRPYGYDAILHMHCRWGKLGNHKLELVDTGEMTYAGMVNEIERIFEVDGTKLEIMRVDLAADVRDVPVTWFQHRVKATHKQRIADFGSAQFVEMGRGGIETLYFGTRPNLFRIYDKVAEYKHQYKQIERRWKSDLPLPKFEEFFGVPENGVVVTRVERQIAADKLPKILATPEDPETKKQRRAIVADLRNAANLQPFEPLQMFHGGKAEPSPEDYTFEHFCTGMYLRERAEREGMHATMRFISHHSNRNTRWALQKYRDFLPQEHPNETVDPNFLNELYRQSVTRQLAI